MTRDMYDAIVIGGGFAGAVAARELSNSGREVLLLEARDRLGGRTWYEKDRIRGFDVETGGGWLGDDEKYAMAEVQRYGIELHRDTDAPARFVWRSANGIREAILPVPFEQLPHAERALNRLTAAASRIDPHKSWSRQDDQALQELEISLPELLEDLNLPAETLGVLAGFWSGISSAPWDRMSALLAARLIAVSGGTFMDFMGTVMLGPRFEHGTIQLLDRMVEDSRAEVLLNAPVQSVITDGDHARVVTANGEYRASAVISTVPINALGAVTFDPPLSAGKQAAITTGLPGKGFKLWMVARNVSGGLFSMGYPGPFHHLFTVDERGDEALIVGFGDAQCPDPDDLQLVGSLLRQYVPEAEVIEAFAHDWSADPYSQGTWAVYPPGFSSAFEEELRRPEGLVFLAGADVSEARPGYIDGAIESGFTVAAKVNALLESNQLIK